MQARFPGLLTKPIVPAAHVAAIMRALPTARLLSKTAANASIEQQTPH